MEQEPKNPEFTTFAQIKTTAELTPRQFHNILFNIRQLYTKLYLTSQQRFEDLDTQ